MGNKKLYENKLVLYENITARLSKDVGISMPEDTRA